jgi:BSD domain
VTFEFDYETFTPVAQALLAEDPELEKMRFELVPKV